MRRAREREREGKRRTEGGTNEGEMEMNGGEERLRASREIIESLLALKNSVFVA